jgi:hypothetical protein
MKRIGAVALLLIAGALVGGAQELALPNRPASLKFAAIGDFGWAIRSGAESMAG